MRIMITGMTRQQCGRPHQLGAQTITQMYKDALRHAGHDVIHDAFDGSPGLDLVVRCDAIMVGLSPLSSVTSHHMYYALHAITVAQNHGIPLTLYVDDWKYPAIVPSLEAVLKRPDTLVKDFFAKRPGWGYYKVPKYRDILVSAVDRLVNQEWPPTVFPAFAWGDHGKLLTHTPRVTTSLAVDPTPFSHRYPLNIVDPADRKREWILGTLADHRQWIEKQGAAWPVRYIGSRGSKAPEKLSEHDLVGTYGGSWGVMSPPYRKLLGTGWWRNRFIYAAAARAILFCDPDEAPQLGSDYRTPLPVIEGMSERSLDLWASRQRAMFITWTPEKDEMAEALASFVTRR